MSSSSAPDTTEQSPETVSEAPAAAPEFASMPEPASGSVAEAALAYLRRCMRAWHLHEPGARLGEDPEQLHDLRIAARRLEATLRELRPVLPESFLRVRPTLKSILHSLGEARDLDMALIELQAFRRELPKADRDSLAPLEKHLEAERARARVRMLSVLDSLWIQKHLQDFGSLLAAPPAPTHASPAPLKEAPDLIRSRYKKLRKAADKLKSDSSVKAYHKVRGHVKKLRYALEALADIYGKPADEMLRSLRRWQEKLGVQQDSAIACRRLSALASAPPRDIPPGTLFSMGRLAEHHARAALRARKLYAKDYRKVRQGWKRLRSTVEAPAVVVAPATPADAEAVN